MAASLLLLAGSALAFPGQFNDTDVPRIACIYPLSGSYALLSRLLYYTLLIVAFVAQHSPNRLLWPILGTLATVATTSGTAAIHTILLACVSSNQDKHFDADIIGAWTLISASILIVAPVDNWSHYVTGHALRTSPLASVYRPVVWLWAILLCIGGICSFAYIIQTFPTQQWCEGAACENACDGAPNQLFRKSKELVAVPAGQVFGPRSKIVLPLMVLTLVFGIMTLIFACALKISKGTKPAENNSSPRPRSRSAMGDPQIPPWAWAVFCILLFPPTITINEIYLLAAGGIPSGEQLISVDQWGSWVGVMLSLVPLYVGAIITTYIITEGKDPPRENGQQEEGDEERRVGLIVLDQVHLRS